MPALAAAARRADPSLFDERQRADAAAKERAREAQLHARFGGRLAAHPMALLATAQHAPARRVHYTE